jgi:S1-C subfamily serine protease
MLRFIAVTLLAFTTLLPAKLHATDWSEVIKIVEKALVWVEVGDTGGCSGFVIDTQRKYVMTAQHCQPTDQGTLWVDRVPAKVVSRDSKKDLLVVVVEHLNPTRIALKLADKNPVRGQEVMSAGYGFSLERPFFRKASVQDDQLMIPDNGIGGPYISTDAPFVGGQSGGPVVDISGNVVSIVQRGDGGTTGLGVGVEIIRERMGRFFGK